MNISRFRKIIWDHYRKQGRKFAWRHEKDPYKIVVSEIMLQQTQTERVVKKYGSFIERFPTWKALSSASTGDLLKEWQGLGYNRRALNLKRTAEIVSKKYDSKLTPVILEKEKLPGIGEYTKGAVQAFAFNQPTVFIETNIRTVFIHYFFPKRHEILDKNLIPIIEKSLDRKNPKEWYYALMDQGAHLKKLHPNPSRKSAHHIKQGAFKGSNREMRSHLLKLMLSGPRKEKEIIDYFVSIKRPLEQTARNIRDLEKEGFIKKNRNILSIA